MVEFERVNCLLGFPGLTESIKRLHVNGLIPWHLQTPKHLWFSNSISGYGKKSVAYFKIAVLDKPAFANIAEMFLLRHYQKLRVKENSVCKMFANKKQYVKCISLPWYLFL